MLHINPGLIGITIFVETPNGFRRCQTETDKIVYLHAVAANVDETIVDVQVGSGSVIRILKHQEIPYRIEIYTRKHDGSLVLAEYVYQVTDPGHSAGRDSFEFHTSDGTFIGYGEGDIGVVLITAIYPNFQDKYNTAGINIAPNVIATIKRLAGCNV